MSKPISTKMKKLTALFLAFLLCAVLTGCAPTEGLKNYREHIGFIAVTNHDNLYYDPVTRVVYILFNEAMDYCGYGYMSPYYADNGLPYLYDPSTHTLTKIG